MSIVIVGAGPNLGLAIARRFGREGLPVGLVSRDQTKLNGLAAQLEGEGIKALGRTADIRDAAGLDAAIRALADDLGPVEVLEYSPLPARDFMKPILETTVEDLRGPRLEIAVANLTSKRSEIRREGPLNEFLIASCAMPVWCEARNASRLGTGGSCWRS